MIRKLKLYSIFQMNNIKFDTEPLEGLINDNVEVERMTRSRRLCPMPIQKETPSGLTDTVCKEDIEENQAGLCKYVLNFKSILTMNDPHLIRFHFVCIYSNYSYTFRNHYVEYLCFLIRLNNLESLSILTTSDLETLLRRANRRLPPRPYGLLDTFFRREMLKVNCATPKFY